MEPEAFVEKHFVEAEVIDRFPRGGGVVPEMKKLRM
jgi:hypothetical protein